MAYHPDELASQPSLLTRWKKDDVDAPAPLPSEGKCGGLFLSTHFITTPNCRLIPAPPPPGDCTVVLYKDGHFGVHDFGRWPQLFNSKHPHLCCIPAKPLEQTDSRRIMWHILSADDFVPSSDSFFTELGKVKPTLCDSIRVHVTKLQMDFKRLDNDTRLYVRNSEGASNRPWVDVLYSQLV
ncbi:hypothetical protein ONZ45_g18931 [Pleurotus djamor]|nr:hypothetical protein ONZ45_g18931 [Pleurotus djamor]